MQHMNLVSSHKARRKPGSLLKDLGDIKSLEYQFDPYSFNTKERDESELSQQSRIFEKHSKLLNKFIAHKEKPKTAGPVEKIRKQTALNNKRYRVVKDKDPLSTLSKAKRAFFM